MRYEVYIRVVGDESSIRALHDHTKEHGTTIEQLKAAKNTGEYWWHWKTPKIGIEGNNVNRGIRNLLDQYRALFPAIKAHKDAGDDVYVELVTYYREGEQPAGLFLTAETIARIGEIGADFDNDTVPDIANKLPR